MMQTNWLLTGSRRNFTGRIARIFNFERGRMTIKASDTRAQLIDNQVCRYYGAVRVGTPDYYRKLREHFAPDPTKPGGYRGQVLNEDHIPEEHRLAAQQAAAPAGNGEVLPTGPGVSQLPSPLPGSEHAPAGAGGQEDPAHRGNLPGASDLPPETSHVDSGTALKTAVLGLDPDVEGFWDDQGHPRLDVVKGLVGREVSREEVHAAAPGHDRETAKLMKTLEG
jgi:hypothetical protein